MESIVKIQVANLIKRLADRKIVLNLHSKAIEWLANAGYDPVYGARPLKRVIQRELQNKLANKLLEGSIKDGDKLIITVQGSELSIKAA